MRGRFRLLPIVIVAATLALTLKLASIWHGLDIAVPVSVAAEAEDNQAAEMDDGVREGKGNRAAEAAQGAGPGKAAPRPGGAPDGSAGRPFDAAKATESELVVLQKLGARRAELERRAEELDMRETLLKAAEKRIDAKIAELGKIKQTVEKLLKKHDAEQEAKLKSLVKIYENMKPKDAARIFEKLEMRILLDVIERMREAKAAPIMAKMVADKAQAVTAALAARRSLPDPKQAN